MQPPTFETELHLPTVMTSLIRPLLTPAQQTKLDAIVKAYEDLQTAEQELDTALLQ